MVTLLLDQSQLEIVLSPTERALAMRRASLRLDRSHIEKVQLTDDAWTWLRGVRAPGTYVPGVVAMGTWRSAGGADFVIVRRGRPAVVIDLDGDTDFQRIVLSTQQGLELVQALRGHTGEELADVAEIAGEAPAPRAKRARRRARPATA